MARRRQRNRTENVLRCRRCCDLRHDGETFYRGLCDSCRSAAAAKRRAGTGTRLLEKARYGGTVDRDGQTFRVVVLPPKRRGGRRIR
jgi:hypothetical protein